MDNHLQIWRRLGRVWTPSKLGDWSVSHAAYPTVFALSDQKLRVYFSTRDAKGRSSLASLDLALDGKHFEVVGRPQGPLLSPGPRGAFDADGVTVTSIVKIGDEFFAYYLGWSVGSSVPFTNTIGLATGDGQTFTRRFNAPIVGRSEQNPLSLGYPWVVATDAGYRMWFGSHLSWGEGWMDMVHVIKGATSTDGESWLADDEIVLPLLGAQEPEEFAVSRPVVLRETDGWSMWYARRFAHYKLGYAWSPDNKRWFRRDHLVHFADPAEDWESASRTYPCVFDHKGHRYMLYNGNGYGREGFGLAILE